MSLKRGGVDHSGHADSQDREAQRLLIDGCPVIADAGAGDYARVSELHRAAQALERGRGEGVHSYEPRGVGGAAGGAQQLGGLNTCGAEARRVLRRSQS